MQHAVEKTDVPFKFAIQALYFGEEDTFHQYNLKELSLRV